MSNQCSWSCSNVYIWKGYIFFWIRHVDENGSARRIRIVHNQILLLHSSEKLRVILYVSSQLCSRYYRCRELHSIVFDLFPGQYADSISRNATVEETERRRIVFGELHGSVWGHYILNGVLAMTERQVQDSSLKWWRWYSLYMMFS